MKADYWYSELDKYARRRKIHQFFFRNEFPTIDKVLKDVNEDPDLPSFRRRTVYKLLRSLNFRHEKRGNNSLLTERDEKVIWRREYLRNIGRFKSENLTIYYLDDSWVNAGDKVETLRWSFCVNFQAISDGLSTDEKSIRWVISLI